MSKTKATPLGVLGICILLCLNSSSQRLQAKTRSDDKLDFVHPGIAHSKASIDFVKQQLAAGAQPWTDAWEKLEKSEFASLRTPINPRANVERGTRNDPDIGASDFMRDGSSAYTHALHWALSGDEAHAKKSAEIIDAWSRTLKTIKNHDAKLLVGMTGHQFCNAAELLKHTWDGWPEKNQDQFREMIRQVWYPIIKDFFPSANGNWDASMLQTMIAMGVFLDDSDMFDRAVTYFREGAGNGAIGNYFNEFGECQESGRDQSHTQMGLEYLANTCETAWNQKVDLYRELDNRLLLGFEYTAKYNLGFDVPYEPFKSFEGRYHYKKISSKVRGRLRPMFEKVFNHYHNRKGLDAPHTEQAVSKVRIEHGGISSLPWGTLMYADNPAAVSKSKSRVICFGDSITKRGYSDIIARLLGVDAINAGVGGHTSAQGLHRMQKDVLEQKPDVVVILFGTNDIRIDSKKYVSVEKYEANLNRMVESCVNHQADVVLCTIPPINEEAFFTRHRLEDFEAVGGLSKMLKEYREAGRRVGANCNVPVVDLARLLSKEPEWLSSDGVHQSPRGNAIIAKHIAKAVAPLLREKPRPAAHSDVDRTEADIVVYGGTSAGVTAAVQAARMRKSVVLINQRAHIGGLTSGGLGATDIGNKDVIGGLSREFYQRVAKHYAKDSSWTRETREEFFANRSKRTKLAEVSGPDATMWTFEPHVAEAILNDLLREEGVTVHSNQVLTEVKRDGNRIASISTDTGHSHHGKMFIDATYEGDLMAKAGVTYRVGREANAEHDETLNGIRAKTLKNQIYGGIDPYNTPGDPSSGLVPLIQDGDGGTPGEGDHRVQAYNFRLCFTNVAENKRELEPPTNYDPARYELAARRAEKIVSSGIEPNLKHFCNPVWMPNFKTDINNSQGISTDFIGGNYDYPDGDTRTRIEIWKAHEQYVRGFWYFMSTSDRLPESLRKQFRDFGPCKDEFLDTDGWPHQLYVREARRMLSDYVMTEHNCRSRLVAKDSIGMAAYGMDSHNCQRIVKNGIARNEGDVQEHGLAPYPISYRSIVPKASECENLLVPVCVSATHIAFGSIRMEPVFMVLGQSSAVAASIAIDNAVPVQTVNYEDLRATLWAAGQVTQRRKKSGKKTSQRLSWTGDKDNDWARAENWNEGFTPKKESIVIIDGADENGGAKTKYDEGVSPNLSVIYVGTTVDKTGFLEIVGGELNAYYHGNRQTRVGINGGTGTIHQSGGKVQLSSLRIGLSAGSTGVYKLGGGELLISKTVDSKLGSLDIGDNTPDGTGTFIVSDGSLKTQSGVTLGNKNGIGIFAVSGSKAKTIQIGHHETLPGFWKQYSGSTLRVRIDSGGVSPITIANDSEGLAGDVSFSKNAILDVGFTESPRSGSWDLMTWNGSLTDSGLKLARGSDPKIWTFSFVDTNASGEPDTLRVTASNNN